jgi:RNA polymerase sigma-70 factor (ECF subfamily)
MSSEDQQMIYLRYFLELSEEETAGALGIPHGTVKSRLHRALKRLRARLDQDEPGFNEVITLE